MNCLTYIYKKILHYFLWTSGYVYCANKAEGEGGRELYVRQDSKSIFDLVRP